MLVNVLNDQFEKEKMQIFEEEKKKWFELLRRVFVNIITADVWEMQYIARQTYHPNCKIFRDVTSKSGREQLICLFGSRTNMHLCKLQSRRKCVSVAAALRVEQGP